MLYPSKKELSTIKSRLPEWGYHLKYQLTSTVCDWCPADLCLAKNVWAIKKKLARPGTVLATVAPLVLAWVRLQKFFPQLFQWKCPLQNASGLAISKMKFQTSAARGPFPRVLNLLYSVYTTRGHNAIMKNGLINNEVFTLQGKKCSVTTEQELVYVLGLLDLVSQWYMCTSL